MGNLPITIPELVESAKKGGRRVKVRELKGFHSHGFKEDGKKELIAIRDLWYQYPDATLILHRIDLVIRVGEFIGLVGHNGSGKTTLAKILVVVYRPTKGTIILNLEEYRGKGSLIPAG